MRTIQSRILKCSLWSILAWTGFAYCLGQPSVAGAEKDDLTEPEQSAVKVALYRLPELRTLDVSEVKKKEAEGAKKLIYLGPTVDYQRSVPRIGYCVYGGLFMEGDHYYKGKLIRADNLDFLKFYTGAIKAALTEKYGKPEPGPKFQWMKVKSDTEVEERCHWNIKATITQQGKPIEIKVACELAFLKNGDLIVSLIDTERAESVEKALEQPAEGRKPLDLGMPSCPARLLPRIARWWHGIVPLFPICR